MFLQEILSGIEYEILQGGNCEVKNITIDSRRVVKGSMFFCIRGLHVDGHGFIEDVTNHGAVCVVVDRDDLKKFSEDVTAVKVKDVREALAYCSSNFFGRPSDFLNIIGVTGTNGKTSSTYFIENILRNFGRSVGIIGTIDSKLNGEHVNIYYSTSTTPDAIELQKILAYMREKNADDVVMEVSSHSLALHKVDALDFKIGIFTNLTQDHLDFHKDMADYLHAKSLLFKNCEIGVINKDDSSWEYIVKSQNKCEFVFYGMNSDCDFKAEDVVYTSESVKFCVNINGVKEDFYVPIPGKFTVYNSLCSIVTAYKLGVPVDIIKSTLKSMACVPGRMQRVKSDKFNVIVDYAHSPDSLENVLTSIRHFTKGKLITVFGCGGDRDKGKRPIMGHIAGNLSDYCIVTSDNPRTESPVQIIEDIEKGIENCEYEKIEDRYEAIRRAIELAGKDDVVLIAGKGHENYQIFADRTIHFDDVETASEILKSRS